MKAAFYLLVLGLAGVTPDLAGECDMAGFYLELGCSAVPQTDNSTICPDAFQCPVLHPDPSMCYYKGVPYKDRSSIPQAVINNPCSQACSCQIAGGPRFECAAVDCVETFDVDLQQQCISTYDLGSCCSTSMVCGTDAIAALKTCEVDGKMYRAGETFEPKNTRKTCICTGEWNGSTEGAYCRDISCGLEIHYQDMVAQKCAPVFVRNMRSCPIAFQCPSSTSKVILGLNRRGVNFECAFGNLTLRVGDEVTVEETCMKCSCQVPPFVSCTKEIPGDPCM